MIRFRVDGLPVPQGSMRGWVNPTSGRVAVTHAQPVRLRSWRQDIASRASDAMDGLYIDGPVYLSMLFVLPRPKGHTTGKGARSAAYVELPTKHPDVDKLTRAVLDALSGIAYLDDAQVVEVTASKVYGESPGLRCAVSRAPIHGSLD